MTRKVFPALLAVLAMTLLMCIGSIAARRLINVAMENNVEFSPVEGSSTPSAVGSLLLGTSAEIGDMVFLNDVRLQPGPGPGLFIVSGASGVRMLVSFDPPKHLQVVPGNVDVKGTIRRLPTPEVLRKDWRLTKNQVRFFRNEQVYIAADYVKNQNR